MTEHKGEGSYEGAEQFQKEQTKFTKEGPVEEKAREAADALDGEEAEVLKRARKAADEGPSANAMTLPAPQRDWSTSVPGQAGAQPLPFHQTQLGERVVTGAVAGAAIGAALPFMTILGGAMLGAGSLVLWKAFQGPD